MAECSGFCSCGVPSLLTRPLLVAHMLNLMNRVVVGALMALVGLLAVYALSIVLGIVAPAANFVGAALAVELRALAALTGLHFGIALAALIVAAVVCFYLLLWELRPNPRSRRPFLVEQTANGMVTVEQRSVVQLVEQAVGSLPDVRHVRVGVAHGRGGLLVRCRVSAIPSAVLTDLGDQIQELTKERIKAQLGLDVLDVSTRLNFDAFRVERRVLD